MANLLTTLKEEITRLARKELKAELDPLPTQWAQAIKPLLPPAR